MKNELYSEMEEANTEYEGCCCVEQALSSQQYRGKAHGNQTNARQDCLPRYQRVPSLSTRQDRVPCTLVVFAVHPCNGHEVREVPQKNQSVENPGFNAQASLGTIPPHLRTRCS